MPIIKNDISMTNFIQKRTVGDAVQLMLQQERASGWKAYKGTTLIIKSVLQSWFLNSFIQNIITLFFNAHDYVEAMKANSVLIIKHMTSRSARTLIRP